MKRIGPIAAKLVSNPIELVAAANQEARQEFEGGDGPVREGGPASPSPIARLEAPRELNRAPRKEADAVEAPASASRGGVKQSGRNRSANLLTMSRSMATASNAEPHRKRFAPSAVVIDLAMWKQAHQWTSPRWGMR